MIVLGIETSCDETAAAILKNTQIVAEAVFSQTEHAQYGGVVPELASRDHIRKLPPMVISLFKDSGIEPKAIDAVAVTAGPGLPGALIIGASFAKAFAYANKIPIIAVNHLEGHIFAVSLTSRILPPFLILLVSGGHTEIVSVDDLGVYHTLGATRDDAVGEAFDKVAQAIGLQYPGGPQIQEIAGSGDKDAIHFPRAMMNSGDFDFSFSGLKTAVLNLLDEWGTKKAAENIANIAASFQEAVVDTLLGKLAFAVERTGISKVAIVGGVASNRRLRTKAGAKKWELFIPESKYCTDNAAMIAAAGLFHLERGEYSKLNFTTKPSWKIDEV